MQPSLWAIVCLVIAAPTAAMAEGGTVPTHVQAILDRHCTKCHGPLEQNAGLRLDSAAELWRGGEEGPVVVAGNPAESKLLQVVAAEADPHMPPKKQLAASEIVVLREWIDSAATRPAAERQPSEPPGSPQVVPTEPAAAIDHFLAASWRAKNIMPAPRCDDRTFLRRVMLDLCGRLPTPDETLAFLFDAAPDKRPKLVDRLLASDEAARTFREFWDLVLMGRKGGRRDDRRREAGWYAFLENSFKHDRPWNEVVREILAARPTQQEDAGAIWFLYERRNDHQQIAEAIAPIIYGTRMDCAQCHDHPLAGEIKQGHYWGLVAAFNRSKNAEKGPPAVGESAVGGFLNFTNLKKESQPAALMLLSGSRIDEPRPANDEDKPDQYVDPSAAVRVPKFSRRAAFAEAATQGNPLLARALVNYTWAWLMGRGLVDPPDEMNTKHPASHPELLDWLAEDVAAHNHSVKRLMRAIVQSRGYQLAPWAGGSPPPSDSYAAALERPLTAEAITRSLQVASGREIESSLRQALTERFPEAPIRPARATIQQTMFLANSEQMAALFTGDKSETTPPPSAEDRVRDIFRRALIRDPDAEELAHAAAFLKEHDNSAAAAGQLLWAIVSGPEFLTNH